MLDNYQHIANLITGFNNGKLTEKEQNELDNWIKSDNRNQLLFEELSDPNRLREYLEQMEGYDEGGTWEKIRKELPLTIIPVRHLFPWKKIAVAASIILTLGVGAYFAFLNKSKKEEIVKLPETKDVEAPKVTKATITLADGRTVSIDSLTTINQASVQLTKTTDGKLIYSGNTSEVVYNTLTNPRGSKVIDMTLADGSHVWLNTGSSVTYPVAFVGNERKVSITGEAYFEVSHKSSMPFVVSKADVQVQVLGTHFNVNAYDDESDIKVTLLEGSVEVRKGNASGLLKPGQQAKITTEVKIINNVDLEQVMAWKNGTFYFNNTNIEVIMREAARWYDVEVQYEGNVKGEFFGGTVPRSENISQLIKALELTKTIKIVVEDKKIIIRPAK